MEFISFARKEMDFSDQLFTMIKGINYAINKKSSAIILNTFLCDYSKDYYTPISNILNLEEMNVYLQNKNL